MEAPKKKRMDWQCVPVEIWRNIFAYVDEKANLALVCKSWCYIVRDEFLHQHRGELELQLTSFPEAIQLSFGFSNLKIIRLNLKSLKSNVSVGEMFKRTRIEKIIINTQEEVTWRTEFSVQISSKLFCFDEVQNLDWLKVKKAKPIEAIIQYGTGRYKQNMATFDHLETLEVSCIESEDADLKQALHLTIKASPKLHSLKFSKIQDESFWKKGLIVRNSKISTLFLESEFWMGIGLKRMEKLLYRMKKVKTLHLKNFTSLLLENAKNAQFPQISTLVLTGCTSTLAISALKVFPDLTTLKCPLFNKASNFQELRKEISSLKKLRLFQAHGVDDKFTLKKLENGYSAKYEYQPKTEDHCNITTMSFNIIKDFMFDDTTILTLENVIFHLPLGKEYPKLIHLRLKNCPFEERSESSPLSSFPNLEILEVDCQLQDIYHLKTILQSVRPLQNLQSFKGVGFKDTEMESVLQEDIDAVFHPSCKILIKADRNCIERQQGQFVRTKQAVQSRNERKKCKEIIIKNVPPCAEKYLVQRISEHIKTFHDKFSIRQIVFASRVGSLGRVLVGLKSPDVLETVLAKAQKANIMRIKASESIDERRGKKRKHELYVETNAMNAKANGEVFYDVKRPRKDAPHEIVALPMDTNKVKKKYQRWQEFMKKLNNDRIKDQDT